MKNWQKLLLTAAALGATVVADDAHEEAEACDFDQPGLSKHNRGKLIIEKATPCYRDHIDMKKLKELLELPSLEAYQEVIGGLCNHSQEITTCMAGVRSSIANCKVKNVSDPFLLLTELAEHIFVRGCQQGVENLALLARGMILLIKRPEALIPLKRCLVKSYLSQSFDHGKEIGYSSESYILYKESERARSCIQYIDDEAYKSAAQWLNGVVHSGMKCKLPDEDRFVLCSEIDPSNLTIISACKLLPFSEENLYGSLEDSATYECSTELFDYELIHQANSTDLDWLKVRYQDACEIHRRMPQCLVIVSSMGEYCLPANEEKQLELVVQFMEDYINRLCVENGAFLTNIMHEVYKNAPQHGNAFRECYGSLKDEVKAEGQLSTNKGRRFYHGFVAYMKCVVGKFHESNEVATGLETAIDDVVKKMKCVNPEDGAVVLCKTLYQEQ